MNKRKKKIKKIKPPSAPATHQQRQWPNHAAPSPVQQTRARPTLTPRPSVRSAQAAPPARPPSHQAHRSAGPLLIFPAAARRARARSLRACPAARPNAPHLRASSPRRPHLPSPARGSAQPRSSPGAPAAPAQAPRPVHAEELRQPSPACGSHPRRRHPRTRRAHVFLDALLFLNCSRASMPSRPTPLPHASSHKAATPFPSAVVESLRSHALLSPHRCSSCAPGEFASAWLLVPLHDQPRAGTLLVVSPTPSAVTSYPASVASSPRHRPHPRRSTKPTLPLCPPVSSPWLRSPRPLLFPPALREPRRSGQGATGSARSAATRALLSLIATRCLAWRAQPNAASSPGVGAWRSNTRPEPGSMWLVPATRSRAPDAASRAIACCAAPVRGRAVAPSAEFARHRASRATRSPTRACTERKSNHVLAARTSPSCVARLVALQSTTPSRIARAN
jgi:hypothetical protein